MSTARLIRSVLEVRPNRFQPGTGILLTIGLAVPIAYGAYRGDALMGVLGSIGALYAGLASYGNVHKVRLRRMALTTVVVAALAFLGSLVSSHPTVSILAVAIVAFSFSLYGSTSPRNSLVGLLGTAILIIVSGIPGTEPLPTALYVLAGGATETVLVGILGPLFPQSVERRSVAMAFDSLADYLEGMGSGSLVPDATPFEEARARLAESTSAEHDRLHHLLRVAETMRAGLVGFARSYRRVVQEDPALAEGIAATVTNDLRDLAEAIAQGRYNALATLAARPPEVRDERFARWVRLLVTSFEEAARPPLPDQRFISGGPTAQSLSLRSLSILHATRFGLAVAAGTAIYQYFTIPLGYWIPLTVTFLLRPDYSTTLQKGLARFVGTFGGVVVASVAAASLPHSQILTLSLSVVGAFFAFALYEASFTLYVGALTFYVVMGLTAQGHPGPTVGYERTTATLLGAALSVIATFLWPVWESRQVQQAIRKAFLAQIEYGEEIVRIVHGGDTGLGERLRQRARSLRVEAERLTAASHLEPSWGRQVDEAKAREWIGTLGENAAELLTLHAQSLEQRAGRIPDEPRSRQRLQHAISEARLMAESLSSNEE